MILKYTDQETLCRIFTELFLKPALNQITEWARSQESVLLKNTGYSVFKRSGSTWPYKNIPDAPELIEPLRKEFDDMYDSYQQALEIEGNYYSYMIREGIQISECSADFYALFPDYVHEFLCLARTDAPLTLGAFTIEAFRKKHAKAIEYMQMRKTQYSIGIIKGI